MLRKPRYLISALSIVLAGIVPTHAGDDADDALLIAATRDSPPIWRPVRGALAGWTMLITAPSADADATSVRLTARFVHEFARHAGVRSTLVPVGKGFATSQPHATPKAGDGGAARWFHLVLCDASSAESQCVVALSDDADGRRLVGEIAAHVGIPARDLADMPRDVRDRLIAVSTGEFEQRVAICLSPAAVTNPPERYAVFQQARRVYEALRAFCLNGSDPPAASDRERDDFAAAKRLARRIVPDGKLALDRAQWFCDRYLEVGISNHSLTYCEIDVEPASDGVRLAGATSVPRIVDGLVAALEAVGIAVTDRAVRSLPDESALDGNLFGVARVPAALTYRRPSASSGLQTEIQFGEPVLLLDRRDGWVLLHASDGYWGWVPCDAIEPLSAARSPLPERGDAARQRVLRAFELLYVPYVFGGCTASGLDCSGLVRNVNAAGDDPVARDAWQQAFAGTLVGTRWHRSAIQAGDQLFFIDTRGKIYHTGLALGDNRFIHAAWPCVQIGSFDPDDGLYSRSLDRDLFIAKRH
jgi:hypothetical protein